MLRRHRPANTGMKTLGSRTSIPKPVSSSSPRWAGTQPARCPLRITLRETMTRSTAAAAASPDSSPAGSTPAAPSHRRWKTPSTPSLHYPGRYGHPGRPGQNARAESKAKKQALDAARAKSKGKSIGQLRELIIAEYGARGIELAPSVVDVTAEMLQVDQQPFGRARSALTAIRMLTSGGVDAIRLLEARFRPGPPSGCGHRTARPTR